jgi:hypothetical protein
VAGGQAELLGLLLALAGPFHVRRNDVRVGAEILGLGEIHQGGVPGLPIQGVFAEHDYRPGVVGIVLQDGLSRGVILPGQDVGLGVELVPFVERGQALLVFALPDVALAELFVGPAPVRLRSEGVLQDGDRPVVVVEKEQGLDQAELVKSGARRRLQAGPGFDDAVRGDEAAPGHPEVVVGLERPPEEIGGLSVLASERIKPAEVVQGVLEGGGDVHGLLIIGHGLVDPPGVLVDRAEDVIGIEVLRVQGQRLFRPFDGLVVIPQVIVALGGLQVGGGILGIELQEGPVSFDRLGVELRSERPRALGAEDRLAAVRVPDLLTLRQGGRPMAPGQVELSLLPGFLGPALLPAGPPPDVGPADAFPDLGVFGCELEGAVELLDGLVVQAVLIVDVTDGQQRRDVAPLSGDSLLLADEDQPPADVGVVRPLGRQGLEDGPGLRIVGEIGLGETLVAPDFDRIVAEVPGLLKLLDRPGVEPQLVQIQSEGPAGRDVLVVLLEHPQALQDPVAGLNPFLGFGVLRVDDQGLAVFGQGRIELAFGQEIIPLLNDRPGTAAPLLRFAGSSSRISPVGEGVDEQLIVVDQPGRKPGGVFDEPLDMLASDSPEDLLDG